MGNNRTRCNNDVIMLNNVVMTRMEGCHVIMESLLPDFPFVIMM